MWSKIVRNTMWLSAGELIARLFRAILVIIAARMLGATEWGILSYTLSLSALVVGIADIGLSSITTREIVKYPDKRITYLSTSFLLKQTIIIAAAIAVIVVTPYLTRIEISQTLLFIAAALIIFDNLRNYNHAIIRALEKMRWIAISQIVTQGTILLFGLFIIFYYASAKNLAAAYVVGSLTGSILTFWLLRNWLKGIFTNFDWNLVKPLITASVPFAFVLTADNIMLSIDNIMLGWFRSAAEIGYYSAAQKGVLILSIFPSIVAISAFPTLTRLASKSKEEFSEVVVKSLKIIFLVALPLSIGGIIVGSDIIKLIYGQEYIHAIPAFQILLITVLINHPINIILNALFAYDRKKEFIKFSVMGGSLNFILNILLIPYFGIEGAAISTVVTHLITNIYMWRKLEEINPFSIGDRLNKLIIASLIMGVIVWLMSWLGLPILIILPVAVLVYFGLLYFMKESSLYSLRELIFLNDQNPS